jgi:23S rRNA pseudoU1915 N3-methylase RlmH
MNNQESDSMPKYNEDIKELDIFGKINLSSKLMEILGQITKNYYGSLPKIEKISILSELSNLGLRNLNLFLTQFSEYSELLEKYIREKVEKKNLNSDADIEKITKRIIFNFAEFIAIHFIKKTSSNMASKNLFESLDELPTNTEAMKLINIATKLDFSGGLNKEKVLNLNHEFSHNTIAKELLKLLIINHLYKFDVEYKKRQEICDKLNISVQAQKNILIDKSKN